MKKQELLQTINDELLEKLYGFCYARTGNSREAEELCSDIVFAIVKAANTDGEIFEAYAFIWRIARNVYADFCEKRKKVSESYCVKDPEPELLNIAYYDDEAEDTEYGEEIIVSVYRRIAFLTKAYREVMIAFYIDGLSTAEIARRQNTSETAVRQRLFSARKRLKNEVEEMCENKKRPANLEAVDFILIGMGDPSYGDPRDDFKRQLSKQVVWLCRKKPRSASEIAEELNVPTVYIEEELEILAGGKNGEYGLLRRLENGRYAINFILLEKEVMDKANRIYTEKLDAICNIIDRHIESNEKKYKAFPYLNQKTDINLILWQQIGVLAPSVELTVEDILKEKYFYDTNKVERPFSLFASMDNTSMDFLGRDGISAENICGYKKVHLDNMYYSKIKKHFETEHNVSYDKQLQMAIRAVKGLKIDSLSEVEKEQAAKAIECGYIYRDGDMLYTKILVHSGQDNKNLFDITLDIKKNADFLSIAEDIAEKMAALIKESVPAHLMDEWGFANILASQLLIIGILERLVEKGTLVPPKDGVGAEGCWMCVYE